MIETVKKVLAILALLCVAVFVITVILFTASGRLAENLMWVIGSLSAFLALGLTTLAIRWLQDRKARELEEERKRAEQEK